MTEPPRPAYNHTRDDSPTDPCPACADEHTIWMIWLCSLTPVDLATHTLEKYKDARDAREKPSVRLAAAVLDLTDRQQELLVTIRNLSQSTPLPDELEGWEGQRAALIAEIGTLRSRVEELELERSGLVKTCIKRNHRINHLIEEISMGERDRFDLRQRVSELIDRLANGCR